MSSGLVPVSLGSADVRTADVHGFRVLAAAFPAGLSLPPHTHDRPTLAVVLDGEFHKDLASRAQVAGAPRSSPSRPASAFEPVRASGPGAPPAARSEGDADLPGGGGCSTPHASFWMQTSPMWRDVQSGSSWSRTEISPPSPSKRWAWSCSSPQVGTPGPTTSGERRPGCRRWRSCFTRASPNISACEASPRSSAGIRSMWRGYFAPTTGRPSLGMSAISGSPGRRSNSVSRAELPPRWRWQRDSQTRATSSGRSGV